MPGQCHVATAALLRTREGCATAPSGVRFYYGHVRAVYNAISVHIRAEVIACYGVADLSFSLRDIGGVDRAVAVCVADEHVHTHWRVRQKLGELVSHAGQRDRERLRIRDTGQVNRHGVTGKDWRSRDVSYTAGHAGVAAHHVISERKHLGVVASRTAGATFHARRSREREWNDERARAAMRFTRNCRGERKAARAPEVTRQGKLSKPIRRCGLKSHHDNLAVGLENGAVGSAIQIAK